VIFVFVRTLRHLGEHYLFEFGMDVLFCDFLYADSNVGMRAPASCSVDDPLRADSEGQRIAAPIRRQGITQCAAAHFHRPLPEVRSSESANPSTSKAIEPGNLI